MLLNNSEAKQQIIMENQTCLELNKTKMRTMQAWSAAQFGGGKIEALNTYTRKEERLEINDLINDLSNST